MKSKPDYEYVEEHGFIDPRFAPLDDRGLPKWNAPAKEESFHDPKFSKEYGFGSGQESAHLKAFLGNPSHDAIEELAEQTRNPELLEQIEEARGEAEAEKFLKENPDYYATDANGEALTNWLEENELPITAQNLRKAFKVLLKAGELEADPDAPRPLGTKELLRVQNHAMLGSEDLIRSGTSNDVNEAIGLYLYYRTNGKEMESPDEFLDDPKLVPLANEAVWYCWHLARTDYEPTPEREKFLKDFARGRRFSIPLLNRAFEQLKKSESTNYRRLADEIIEKQNEVSEQDLNSLSDDEVVKLYKSVQRHRAGQ